MNSSPSVLVIDGASDTGTVLKAVLEPRGATVERSRSQRAASRFAATSSPRVVVIDADAEPEAFEADSPWHGSPRVILGTHRPQAAAEHERFLEKPFHFPELVRVIEELLDDRSAA